MNSPSPVGSQSQSNASFYEGNTTMNTSFGTQSRRRPRPQHQSQASISASHALHPQKKPRQTSVIAQRELNASPEAVAAVAAATMEVSSIRSYQEKKKSNVVEWAKTSKYCVAQLVGLPMELRDTGGNYNKRMVAFTDHSSGNVLLIKEDGVDVWRYDDVQVLPKPNHFPLPGDEFNGKVLGVPLPLGSLVSPVGSSDEAGLVVVLPVSGRIAYWDSVSSAMTEGLLQRRRGVEGHLQLYSNEYVRTITNIEPAGFVLCTNQNRVVHLSLRDGVGKPVVQVTTLKNVGSSVVGGLLGGIASAFKTANIKKEIVAVRAGRIVGRAERQLFVATSHGHLTRWEASRNGAAVVLSDVDLREQLLQRALAVGPSSMQTLDKDTFTILDISAAQSDTDHANVLVLASWDADADTDDNYTHYILFLVTLAPGNKFNITKAHYLSCFQSPLKTVTGSVSPQVYLPNPYRTAFVVFSQAVVMVSIIPEDMPDPSFGADLPDVAYNSLEGFEDVVDFKRESEVEIIGSGLEELSQDASNPNSATKSYSDGRDNRRKYYSPGVVVVTKGAGVLKLTVYDNESGEVRPKPSPRPVPVKSKLELAVFFGTNEKNLLNFNGRPELSYSQNEIETAARSLSMDILCSHGQYLASYGPSVDIYLEMRAQKLRALAQYLQKVFPPIAREIRWKLLWDAEKVASARAVYRSFAQKQSAGADLSEGLLREIIAGFFQRNNIPTEGLVILKDWFALHLPNLWKLLPLLQETITSSSGLDHAALGRRIHEANEIYLTILSTAQEFRSTNAELYGLENDMDENRVANFQSLPSAPWTSAPETLTALNRTIELNQMLVKTRQKNKDDLQFTETILDQLVELTRVACCSFVERFTWCETQESEDILLSGKDVRTMYLARRNDWIKELAYAGRDVQAIEIAEWYHDYRSLVELSFETIAKITVHMESNSTELSASDVRRKELEAQRDDLVSRLEGYFNRFGQDFAFGLYEYQVENGNLRELILQFPGFNHYLDAFLSASSNYNKLRWINDVRHGKYREAGETLVETAESETDLWSKSVELSIGKLALMIGQSGPGLQHLAQSFDTRLKQVDLQKEIFNYVHSQTRVGIDLQAAVEIAMEVFGTKVGPYYSLRDVFKRSMSRLLTRQTLDSESIIDLVTLLDESDDLPETWPGNFQMALENLVYTDIESSRKEEARKTIWRRLYQSDNWLDILDTSYQDSTKIESRIQTTNIYNVLVTGYKQGLFEEQKASMPLAPDACISTQSLETLKARFPDATSQWVQSLYEELQTEAMAVKNLVSHNLMFWFPWICETARKEAEADQAETGRGLLTNGSTIDLSFEDTEMDMS